MRNHAKQTNDSEIGLPRTFEWRRFSRPYRRHRRRIAALLFPAGSKRRKGFAARRIRRDRWPRPARWRPPGTRASPRCARCDHIPRSETSSRSSSQNCPPPDWQLRLSSLLLLLSFSAAWKWRWGGEVLWGRRREGNSRSRREVADPFREFPLAECPKERPKTRGHLLVIFLKKMIRNCVEVYYRILRDKWPLFMIANYKKF